MKYFKVQELVPQEIYELLEEDSIKLIDSRLIETIDFIRGALGKAITVNNWHCGGTCNLRGLRPKNCKIGAKKSAHKEGLAVDFDVQDMTAQEVRNWIKNNSRLLPHPIRVENYVNWVHIDMRKKEGYNVYFFNP